MEEAETLADRIMILKRGKMVTIGDSMKLKNKFDSKYTVALTLKTEKGTYDTVM